MARPRLTKLELQIMDAFWRLGACSVREVQETFPEPRPAYTTVQTTVYRLERKQALRCVKRIGNANVFAAAITREQAQRRMLDEMLAAFRGRAGMVVAHLVDSGELTLDHVREAEKALRELANAQAKVKEKRK